MAALFPSEVDHRSGGIVMSRQFLILFLPIAILLLAAVLLIGQARVTAEMDRMAMADAGGVDLGAGRLRDRLEEPLRDLRSLATEPATRAAVAVPTVSTLDQLAGELTTLLRRDPRYEGAIWVDQTGRERIRACRAGSGPDPVTVPPERLTDLSGDALFLRTVNGLPGAIHITGPDGGQAGRASGRALRLATPVAAADGTGRGVMMLAVSKTYLFQDLLALPGGAWPMVLDQSGGWLFGGSETDRWDFVAGRQSLASAYPVVWARMTAAATGRLVDASGIWTWRLVQPTVWGTVADGAGDPRWLVVTHRSPADVAAARAEIWELMAGAAAPLLGLFALLSWFSAAHTRAREQAARAALAAEVAEREGKRRVADLEQAHRASAMLAAIVTSSDDAIVSKTLEGRITSWNPGAERLFGYTAEEMIGQFVTAIFPADKLEEEEAILDRVRRGETVGHFDTVRRHKDGHLVDISVAVSPIRDTAGRIVGASKIARDIAERKRAVDQMADYRRDLEQQVAERTQEIVAANSRLEAALRQANAANDAKSRFVANMSHELRTPMNAVLGFLALVLERDLPPEIRRQLLMAHRAAQALLALMNDLLDLSRLQSGSLVLEPVLFDLRGQMRACLDQVREKAREKGLTLALDYVLRPDQAHIGDPARVRQIVLKLLDNAIKFTQSGHVRLSVQAGPKPGLVELVVSDTGIGMTADQVDRIVDPFFQADSRPARRFNGLGLGVSICKELAELMGGAIAVESRPGQGSTFRVRLWLPAAPAGLPVSVGPVAPTERAAAARSFTVLLVDDVVENLELAQLHLKDRGHAVVTARDGEEAVALSLDQRFDIILMDVQMPRCCGKEATRRIRAGNGACDPTVPIIGLSADESVGERQACLDAGMTAYVTKPVDYDALADLMQRLVPGGVAASPAGPFPSPAAPPAQGAPVLDGAASPAARRALTALRDALESDDVERIDPALHNLRETGLAGRQMRTLERLVHEFEFEQARAMVAGLDEALAARGTTPAAVDQGLSAHG
ncbi:PAS domain S-box protein [Nitrospirillum sp. BR 11828]|uniref:PAS domain S-box protein n=1 Tax=Nitrospirillum sp. BR 11828 TaxID=3104325 RepID=UPI002ACAC945|nr:PAS domain S-box protein [Nitrospirillum sp. BR 11828]MDZ5647457.1 PAS domain S-box protein [Nitrospirillum sp. BR 11828]